MGIQQLSENGTELSVTRVRIHEDFINLISQDIALLKLKDPISWSPLIQPVCLPSPKLKPSLGSMCWVIGWGQTDTQGKRGPKVLVSSEYNSTTCFSIQSFIHSFPPSANIS